MKIVISMSDGVFLVILCLFFEASIIRLSKKLMDGLI